MAQINEAESLRREIESHSHFGNCLPANKKHEFYSKKNDLIKARDCFNDLKNIETDIINATLIKRNSEKELNNLKAISEKDLDNVKQKLNLMDELNLKTNENELNNLKDRYKNFQLKKKYDIEQLNKDISNLKNQIEAKKESLNMELDLKTKEELFKLKNEYQIELLRYTNKKKLEKQEKEKEDEIKRKKFEADKAIEFMELKRKADLVQRIICMYKNISLS